MPFDSLCQTVEITSLFLKWSINTVNSQVESGVEIPFEKARVLKGHDSEVGALVVGTLQQRNTVEN